jgi:hypothetical protein
MPNYEEESVKRSQIDMKLKTCDIRTWEKHLFLDTCSTNTDIFVPPPYEYFETRNIEIFALLSQPLLHLRFKLSVFGETFSTQLWTALAMNTSYLKQEHFFMNTLRTEFFCPQKCTTERCSLVVHTSSKFVILTTETSLWTCACASAT